jgi:methyl-accepting chemotaxis protein
LLDDRTQVAVTEAQGRLSKFAMFANVMRVLVVLALLGAIYFVYKESSAAFKAQQQAEALRLTAEEGEKTVQAENESLNNSVISLLQAVFQLSNRDLTARAVVSEDVIGTVSSSVNQFADETARTLGEVQSLASQVRAVSNVVTQQAEIVQRSAAAEQRSVQSMVQNLGQASDQLVQVATLSDKSSQAAERAAVATQSALTAVEGTIIGMENVRETIGEVEKRFKRLGERTQEISNAVGLVNTISERTHLLALNASMQAATAGEAGRGFAVVAQEVQRLSDNSREATLQISQLVGNIQSETGETVQTVNRLISDVVRQSELAQQAGMQMTQTQVTTQQLVAIVQQIAQFSAQQAKLATVLRSSLTEVSNSTVETSEAITRQGQSTKLLGDYSARLTDAVGVFKIA